MFKNIGWTLGNDCPCNCNHCYSMQVREKGANFSKEIADRIIDQIISLGAETVNFGGNEPIYTNGLNYRESLLTYIINEVTSKKLKVGITTSGLSAIILEKNFKETFIKINDIDVSIDSPIEAEHDMNRGKRVFKYAIQTLELCKKYGISCSIVMCAMNWNFTIDRIKKLMDLAKQYDANIRINMLKPVEKKHIDMMPTKQQIYEGYKFLIENCEILDISDPILAGVYNNEKVTGCSCGISSLRINSITPTGEVSISPCVYMHHYKVGNILKDNILDVIKDNNFKEFAERKINYKKIEGCKSCNYSSICRGGCAAASYWYNFHTTGEKNMFCKDPYCIADYKNEINTKISYGTPQTLVHQNYLCTWIGKAKK